MKVAIAGGGIGGLTAALCLAESGHEVVIAERVGEFSEVGAGIQVSPNAGRVLDAVGLVEDFARIATFPERIVLRRWSDDSVLRETPLGPQFRERFGLPYANVHRGDLARLLVETLAVRHGIEPRLGSKVVACDVGGDSSPPALVLDDGSAIEAEVVVGADGVHSSVRRSLFGDVPARFSGAVAYRALVPLSRLGNTELEVINRLGPDSHVVSYVIGRDDHLLNLVCVVPEQSWTVESWTELGSPDSLRASFAEWSPELRHVLCHVGEPVHRWALHDRDPLGQWGDGAVTLLGDACHPMLPFLAQGACQAIEDAWVLARAVDRCRGGDGGTGVAGALRAYEASRQSRTARVQDVSRRNRDLFHLPDGEAQQRRDAALGRDGGIDAVAWLYGFDPVAGGDDRPS